VEILIIGAGPAGLMCAGNIVGHNVIIIEKNEKVGKKLFLSGKGKCNISSSLNKADFKDKVNRNYDFVEKALDNFSYQECMDFFQSYKVPLDIFRGNRIFPKSEKSSDIIKALYDFAKKTAQIKLNEKVLKVEKKADKYLVTTTLQSYTVDKVIIATGGLSYPSTGSTGDGLYFLEQPLIPTKPALVPLLIKPISLQNELLLKNVRLFTKDYSFFGDLSLHNSHLEGPIALALSSKINRQENVQIYIDFKPALTIEQLEKRIEASNEKSLHGILNSFLPRDIIRPFLYTCKAKADIAKYLKEFPLNYIGLDSYARAIITSGGIDVNYLDENFMSKIHKDVYYIGEVIDVDCMTGGINLHTTLAVAKLVGKSIR
jgi:predicted Rossmann fold flavoprotein